LNAAIPVLEDMISGGGKTLDGEQVFKLVDTYGLPVDMITEEAEKRGVVLDTEGFERLMEERKEQSRKGSDISSEFIFQPDHFSDAPTPSYSGELPLEADLEFILKGDRISEEILEGEYAEIITSPQSGVFYAEAGGQVGDGGSIVKKDGRMDILDTFEADGRKIFRVHATKGRFKKHDRVTLDLDAEKKKSTARNHTATHLLQAALRCVLGLLQAALRCVLGDQVMQSGSLVDERRLRFDFTHMRKLSDRELVKVEDMVNAWIREGILVSKKTKAIKEAKEDGALSFFGEKYGETVRVVSIGDRSKEFCGGTHVDNTADIEIVKIMSESSVASGIRRIEALTAENARIWLREAVKSLFEECRQLAGDAGPDIEEDIKRIAGDIISGDVKIDGNVIHDYEERIRPALLKERERLEKAAKKRQKEETAGVFSAVKEKLDEIIKNPVKAGDINLISDMLEEVDMQLLRKAAGYLEREAESGVILLGSSKGDKAYLICAVTPDLAKRGIDAREIMNGIAGRINGGGGGKPTFAQAGGKNPGGLQDALEEGKRFIENIT